MLMGLTGVFGSGKSTVARMFAEKGAPVVDADAWARKVVEPGGPALDDIRTIFGEDFLDCQGELDRKKMAQTVFQDRALRARLNAIIHPRVQEGMEGEIREIMEEADGGEPLIVLNVPLLYEAGMEGMADKVVVVAASEGARFYRARKRDGLSERDVVRRFAAQWPLRWKREQADYVIENSGSLDETRIQVEALWAELRPSAA